MVLFWFLLATNKDNGINNLMIISYCNRKSFAINARRREFSSSSVVMCSFVTMRAEERKSLVALLFVIGITVKDMSNP